MEETVNSCHDLFMKYIKERPSEYTDYSSWSNLIKERLEKIASLNRIHVFTDSYISFIVEGSVNLLACLDHAIKDDDKDFFGDVFYYLYNVYCTYFNFTVGGGSIDDCDYPFIKKMDDEGKRIAIKTNQTVREVEDIFGADISDYDLVKTAIVVFLTRCYINKETYLFNELADKFSSDPIKIIDDLMVNGINSDNVIDKEKFVYDKMASFVDNKQHIF